jgi:MYXO-CTERM domain-containing protein
VPGTSVFYLAEPAPRDDGCATAPVGDLGFGLFAGLALLGIRRRRRRPVHA